MYKKILVPLDGSEVAEAILSHIEALAGPLSAEVTLLEVLPETGVLPERARDEITRAKEYLGQVEARLKDKGVKTRSTLRYGKAAAEIIDYAKVNDIDLIAMSTHGRSGVSRWVFGSVADKVLRGTNIPILLIRAPGVLETGLPPIHEYHI